MNAPVTQFLDVADRLGARLCRDAIWAGDRCNWLGWAIERSGQGWAPVYRVQSASLYDGTAGIALFLSHLVRFTADPHQRITLEGALNHVRGSIASGSSLLGYYTGMAGTVSVFLQAFDVLGNERWLEAALDGLALLAATPPDPTHLDVMSGSAGSIPMLLYAAQRFEREDFLSAAQNHGEMLLRAALVIGNEFSWATADGSRLIGYAHGAGGIACALLDLAIMTGADRWFDAFHSALRFERRHFSEQWRNWPDLRTMNPNLPSAAPNYANYPVAWCHGATGVGFSRLRAREALTGDSEVLSEVETAVEATRAALRQPLTFGNGYSLCHGAGGQADLLIEAARSLGRPDLHEEAANVGRAGIVVLHEMDVPWPCGVPAKGESPNLMLGIAGIGYFYLRLHAQDLVPSVLLQVPRCLVGTSRAAERLGKLCIEVSQ